MLLRASGETTDTRVDLSAVTGEVGPDTGVAYAAELVAFTEAVMGDDEARLGEARGALRAVLTDAAWVDACAVIGAFNVVDRIADATGIPLDPMIRAATAALREELDLGRFRSSANTPAD